MSDAVPEKAEWRARLKARRATVSEAECATASERIRARLLTLDAVRQARTLFCFVSRGGEPDTRPLIEQLAGDGRTILIPRILGATMIAVEFPGWAALAPGVLGIPAPTSERAFAGRVDVVITPGLGFTPAGDRLGMGRGYYDRWFASNDYGLSIAVCFDWQVVPSLPVGETDMPVDLIVTEQRLLRRPAPG
jgi:5-formyltetrahydrofolate cyclo-ligase